MTEHGKLVVLTLIGGIDVIGELDAREIGTVGDLVTLSCPCLLQMRSPTQITINDMSKNSPVLTGESIFVNMAAVMWMAEPSKSLSSAYYAHRAGLTMPGQETVIDQ